MARNARQAKILELISKIEIDTQDELSRQLQLANFNVTQATVSRDMKELGLVKINANGRQKYVKESSDNTVSSKIVSMFRHAVVTIDSAVNIVVIKTLAGSANAAGAMIDRMNNSDILGCVAGDDTVMAVCRSERCACEIVDALNALLNE